MENKVAAVSMHNVTKTFGSVIANNKVNLEIYKGEILALLGENGSGKTTLMNMLSGIYFPDEGEIKINGKEAVIRSPKDAFNLGIGMVHQHFMLIPTFTVAQNIVLGAEPCKGIVVDEKTARENVIAIAEKYKMDIDPDAKVVDISVGMQQRVEILKVLYKGVQTLILDEPTASLTPQEIAELMDIIEALVSDGKSVIIITHKMKEIKACADRCTIIRQGKYIDTIDVDTTSEDDMAAMMVGRKVAFKVEKEDIVPQDVCLKISDLHANDYRGIEILKGFDISVRSGEIVGIAGVDGNGQMELAEIISGLRQATAGSLQIHGKEYLNSTPKQLFDAGISAIPADRQKHGLVLEYSVEDNLIIQHYNEVPFSEHGMMKRDKVAENAHELQGKFDIRPDGCEKKPVENLSGGNQQKVIIAREVTNDKDILVAVNPTRGLDVGAIEVVHRYIVEQRNKNKAVLLISFELDEIINLSDRIVVIFEGKNVGEIDSKSVEQELGLLMAGGK